MSAIPHAFERVSAWRAAREQAGRMLVAVDFDGTLAPIVERPEDARPLPRALPVLERLAARSDTDVAIVSGRGLEDVRRRLRLDALYYAGNHGMEIEGPGVQRTQQEAAAARPRLEHCMASVQEKVGAIEGVQVEDKDLTFTVHYRRVAAEDARARVRAGVRDACAGIPGLRLTEGKMVVEVRPDVDWHKGLATRFLLESLTGDANAPAVLFLGDDATDEDAFRELAGSGDGILVADPPPGSTAAAAWVRSPEEVLELLDRLARGS